MVKRLTAIILTLTIVFTVCSTFWASASEKEITNPQNLEEYSDWLENESCSVSTPTKKLGNALLSATGRHEISKKHFNFVVDDMVGEICDHIKEESSLDLVGIISSVPETNQGINFVYETFDIDSEAVKNIFMQARFKCDEQENYVLAVLFHFLGVYFGIIEECKAYCVPLEEENVYEIHLAITVKDGSVEDIGTGVVFNTETQQAYGKDGNGILGTGYSFSIPEVLLYAQVNAWVRDFGFCFFYDLFSYTTPFFFYETRRIKFDHDGLEWMIQLWKGNYVITNGAEIGIYSRDEGKFGTFYNCATDDQMMEMSMELYHGDELIFSRPKQLHWWLTGFRITDNFYPADSMTLKFSIDMQSEEMLKAFCNAIDNHYMHDMTYTVDGFTVNVIW
ncbi:MAG: DUF4474 domain-containing protein [Clostridia bacterium]|nr:DUF4474 domain-containing protein [Clostridia bacterium]